MNRRLLDACLHAYPRDVRDADGEFLRDLALELGDHRSAIGQAWSLLSGGVRERVLRARRAFNVRGRKGRVAATALALGCIGAVLLALVTFGSTDTDVEVRSCVEAGSSVGADACGGLERLAAARERDGWDCSTRQHVVNGRSQRDLECRREA